MHGMAARDDCVPPEIFSVAGGEAGTQQRGVRVVLLFWYKTRISELGAGVLLWPRPGVVVRHQHVEGASFVVVGGYLEFGGDAGGSDGGASSWWFLFFTYVNPPNERG